MTARITATEIVPYALPFAEPYVTARGSLARRELILVRIRSDDGAVGLGEAVPLSLRGGPDLPTIAAELERCTHLLEGEAIAAIDADAARGAISRLLDRCREGGASLQALAAIETALFDLAGKSLGKPVWRLLGASIAQPVTCNATLPSGDPDSVARLASDWAERGFSTFKLKLGAGRDREQVDAVRAAVGEEARIRVDANGAWDVRTAVTRLAEIEPSVIELAEQPTPDLEDLALVRQRTAIPVAADESVVDAADARRAMELGACALATVKLAKAGGIEASLAVARELPVYLSSALDGPVGIAAAAHLAQALPAGSATGLAHGLATGALFSSTVSSVACDLVGDQLRLPDGPGLAIEIDEAALERHRL